MVKDYQKKLALQLLDWHGGMSSGLYAVGSCMLADAERGVTYKPQNCTGHVKYALPRALDELRNLKRDAKFPETVTPRDVRTCRRLAARLEKFVTRNNLNQ